MTSTFTNFLHALALATGTLPILIAAPAAAQQSTSREVVQALPSKDVQRLNRALLRLAKRPDNVAALLEAGEASAKVGDLDAAIGFYRRANNLAPNDARTKLGMARVVLNSGRPADALPLYAAAQSAGANASDLLSDRALAFDMVGDNASAQSAHRQAVALQPDDNEAKRRLAISYAISGNRAGFEDTLRPMLDRRDFASFRTRAFGLAIMGEQDRAAAIVDAVMPRDLAGRINPYLEFMPRLTKAQQAAAANLGIFPQAADIGREDPRIAAYKNGSSNSDAAIAQAADSKLEPAGAPLGEAAETVSVAAAPAPEPGFDLATVAPAEILPAAASPVEASTAPSAQQPASVADAFADLGSASLPTASKSGDAVDLAAIEIRREGAAKVEAEEPAKPDHPSRIWVQLATGRDVSALKFDWRRFTRKAPGLLDDFKPHVTPWGQATRLLAGPVDSRRAASELINALKQQGVDTFRFISPEGTEIKELK
ncbi:tetratricopeptide repeat protein [Erythrobacter crassostreae]|uniref:Tetratricopeptide repeat protein n=1 Tax=Erythrobacter crassostreae TaxID=2828328 RepID=A0A9X1JKQ5_9SPHN|nr:SPOR domain-containing protein [Erythrobacter crassostrea]MBV7259330.1 tetratricopeptide repeat protein [Erythrobacter crassostrea]